MAWDGPAGRPAMPMALLATLGAAYGPIGNPAGHIARWRAAMVRQAPRLCAPGAVVGLVCALGAISAQSSALGAISAQFCAPGTFFSLLACWRLQRQMA